MLLSMIGRTFRTRIALVVMIAAVGTVLSGAALAQTVTDENVTAMMGSAKTAAEFQALSAYFTEKATQASAVAKRHRAMLAAIGQGPGKPPYTWSSHCDRLIQTSNAQVSDYTAMAKAYAKLAAAAPKSQ